jgi:hypothetical protein
MMEECAEATTPLRRLARSRCALLVASALLVEVACICGPDVATTAGGGGTAESGDSGSGMSGATSATSNMATTVGGSATSEGPTGSTSEGTSEGGDVPPWDGDDPSCGDGVPKVGVHCFTVRDVPGLAGVVAVADFDIDGHLDLFGGGEIRFGDGAGSFPDSVAFSFPPEAPAAASFAAVAELDGQAGPDMLLLGPDIVAVLRNDGSGLDYSEVVSSTVAGVDFLNVVRAATLDLDDDGVADLLGANSQAELLAGQPVLVPLLNDGMGAFTLVTPSLSFEEFGACLVSATAWLPEVAAAGEGVAVVAGPCSDSPLDQFPLLVARSTGAGSLTYGEGPAMGANPRAVAAGWLDEDAFHDLVVWAEDDSALTVYPATPKGDFLLGATHAADDLCPGCPCLTCGLEAEPGLISADLDGDGQTDLVLKDEATWVVLRISTQPVGHWLESRPVLAGDFNEDDVDDLVARNGQVVQIMLSNP